MAMTKDKAIHRITVKAGKMREPMVLHFESRDDADETVGRITRIFGSEAVVDRFAGIKLFAGNGAVADAVETIELFAQ